jgi:hypothetical protein
MCLVHTGDLTMVNKHVIPLGDQEIMWSMMSLQVLKFIEQEKVQLTRSVTSISNSEYISNHERYVNLQYDTLEEFFTRIFRYLETHGTPKTLASQTLQEILSILVCQSCGEI